jgi:hypothetical protein
VTALDAIDALADTIAHDPHHGQRTQLVVLRDGELMLERHAGDATVNDLAGIYSVTKSIVCGPPELSPGWRNPRHAVAEALA